MEMREKVLVTGGAGYVGCVLVPKLLGRGYNVRVLDSMIFTDKGLNPVKDKCEIIEGDIRDTGCIRRCLEGVDYVIHLAAISNDPCSELCPELTKQVNLEATKNLINLAKEKGIKRFVHASSSSVLGVKKELNVTEDLPVEPLTIYSKTKAQAEEFVRKSNTEDFTTVCLRPATICGYSPRMRLDLTVAILTEHALSRGKITVFGGEQKRPNIHIDDATDHYIDLLTAPKEKIAGEVFHAGYENYQIMQIAEIVKEVIGNHVLIEKTSTKDLRDYHISSEKIKRVLGFYPKKSVRDAVMELKRAFENGLIPDPSDSLYRNIEHFKKLGLGARAEKHPTKKPVKFIDLPLQHESQKQAIYEELRKLLEKGDFILGEAVEKFEQKIAEYCGTKYALGVNSGTDALILAMRAYGIREGDEVISVANSFLATAGAILACKAKPIFVDVGEDYLIDPEKITEAITDKTKAILPVHLTGRIADMDKINKIAQEYNLKVIEDSCQAIGAEYNGKRAGSLADAGCFSLHPLKTFNVLGDGGFITMDNEEIYRKIKKLRNHGLKNRDEADFFGINSRLDTLNAAVALKKLDYLEEALKKRRENAFLYRKNLKNVKLPAEERVSGRDTYYLFMIQSDKREQLQEFLTQENIESKVHYPLPIHLQKAAEYLGYKKGGLPETESQAKRILSLPIHQNLEKEEIFRVIDAVNDFYNSHPVSP